MDYFLQENESTDDEKRLGSFGSSLQKGNTTTNLKKLMTQPKSKDHDDKFDNSFINLTNRETFNNLIGTYSAITIILKNIYEKYYSDKQYAEMVDNLSSQTHSYPTTASDNERQYFKLSELPSNIIDDFCSFMEQDNPLTDLDCEITEYASALFQNIRTMNSLSSESLYNSLNPRANKKILLKSFEKTSAKGGKPLIKTHDKRFLIKEISEEERDFFLFLVKNYHTHLKENPRSLLAKIYGCFSIRVNNKNKVYHILMENLDPLDDDFILFKYDMKFSTVNRKEINSNSTIRGIKNTFMKRMPWSKELFEGQEEFMNAGNSGSRSSGGFHAPLRNKKSELVSVIEEESDGSADEEKENDDTLDNSKEVKTRKYTGDDQNLNKNNRSSSKENDSPLVRRVPQDEDSSVVMRFSNVSKKSKIQKGLKTMSKNIYGRTSYNSSSNYDDEIDFVDPSTLKKLGLLKDEDFLKLHKYLFVDMDSEMEVEMMNASIAKDVKFLTDLKIMDYSLFVVIVQAPDNDPFMRNSSSTNQDSDSEDEPETNSNSQSEKQAGLTKAIASMASSNKYILYSKQRNFIYLVGLIDYLQKYIRKKKFERLGKQLVAFNNLNEGDTDFSCKPPEEYCQRFMEKVTQVFITPSQIKLIQGEFETETEGYCRKRF